jgi:hypothetical protein
MVDGTVVEPESSVYTARRSIASRTKKLELCVPSRGTSETVPRGGRRWVERLGRMCGQGYLEFTSVLFNACAEHPTYCTHQLPYRLLSPHCPAPAVPCPSGDPPPALSVEGQSFISLDPAPSVASPLARSPPQAEQGLSQPSIASLESSVKGRPQSAPAGTRTARTITLDK